MNSLLRVLIERVLRPVVLIGPLHVHPEIARGAEHEVGVAQELARELDEVRFAGRDDLVRLMRIQDEADGADQQVGYGALDL
jgi:hypothetical protein